MTKLTFLGTGTSSGVPMIGCDCPVCTSTDKHDKRLRASALVETGGLTILIDAGPDFRQQMLREGVRHLDAILLTHNHMDHIGGLDETRAFNLFEAKPVNIYCEQYVLESLRQMFGYAFAQPRYPGAPEWHMHTIDGSSPFFVHSNAGEKKLVWESGVGYHYTQPTQKERLSPVKVVPIQGWHHKSKDQSVLGYRIGNIAYITDFNRIEEDEFEKLSGLDYVTVNCVKKAPHYSHFSLDEALAFIEKVGASESYITHMSHLLPRHADFEAELPGHVHPAYDGLVLESD